MPPVERQLAACLPPRWTSRRGRGQTLVLRGPDGARAELALEVRRSVAPRDVPSLAARLRAPSIGLVYAPFLSPRARVLLREAGISYLDATGNARIAVDRPALFIETRGAERDPLAGPTRSIRSLKGRAGGRVVRALCDFVAPFGIRELAERSGTPLGSVARVAALLDQEALLSRDKSGRVLSVQWPELLRRWARDYDVMRSNDTTSWLAPRGVPALSEGLRRARGRWCLSGSLAGSRKTAVAPARLAFVYADEPETLAEGLGLRRADTGANVILACPFDAVVFDRAWEEDGLRFAALPQVAVDLLTSPGRGPAEAEELIDWMEKHESRWRS
jgi:hypothetical protein